MTRGLQEDLAIVPYPVSWCLVDIPWKPYGFVVLHRVKKLYTRGGPHSYYLLG